MTYTAFPNTFHNDKWVLTFSNIPNVKDLDDMKYFQNYIKSLVLPDYNMGNIASIGPLGIQVNHPQAGQKRNTELSQLQIEFKVSEDFVNYLTFFKWMMELKYGRLEDGNYEGKIREFNIKRAVLSLLDNQKRTVANITFTKLFLLNLSSIQLTMGASDEVSFTCNLNYEEISYEFKDPSLGGSNPTQPTLIDPCGTSGMPLTTTSADWEI